ncbi:hypothetical protein ACH5RR_007943 [Cinchona calisaya]|uniref:Uncharacterized protein n=1 Tax=Cinchona calisaya TaxID=153742 RepID=A0ABD3AA65_9GENT
MEIEGSDGSNTLLEPGCKVEWGRGSGFKSDDRTVSRRHVDFELCRSSQPTSKKARFQVVGKNPIWVHSRKSGKVSTFRTSETGEMEIGDMFCVSAKNSIWFAIQIADFEAKIVKKDLGFESICELQDFDAFQPNSIDISLIDPVKEFGVLVIGKEFDSYPKKMIRDIKNWDWFLEEGGEVSEEDEFDKDKRKKDGRRKRKKGGEDENEVWTGESEEEKELLLKATKVGKPKYLTRSKDRGKLAKDTGKGTNSRQKNTRRVDDEEEDEDDETLGGFIVDNDELEEEGEEIGEEEEEEFEEDEDEEELED